jgi:hypothetical protein
MDRRFLAFVATCSGPIAALAALLLGLALSFGAGWAIVGIMTVTVAAAVLLTAFSMLVVRTVNQPGAPSWPFLWTSQK